MIDNVKIFLGNRKELKNELKIGHFIKIRNVIKKVN